jgi:PPM family protein phosphatase
MVVPDTGVPGAVLHWQAHGLTDRGRRRRRNEDALLVPSTATVFAVADGMGGHAAGNVASRLAVATLAAAFPGGAAADTADATARRLQEAFTVINEAILAHGRTEPGCAGMGTTLTALAPAGDIGVLAHVGDSRAYRVRGDELARLTHDHTWVQQQVEAGMLTPESARHHARASVLTRALGVPGTAADIVATDVLPGDLFLLCSDGLTNMLEDTELRGLLLAASDLKSTAARLVAEANERGGIDNITVLLLRAVAP